MDHDSTAIAAELDEWFQSVARLTDAGLFSIAPDGPHRDAVVLDALRRNARTVYEAELDTDGRLYSPICFFLAAACRQVGVPLRIGHWRAALDNVRNLQRQLGISRSESLDVGLDLGSPATIFKAEFDEAVRQAGLIDGVSFLSKKDREVALGLAINWGIRLLLTYSVSTSRPPQPSKHKDLAWLADRVARL
ncbi:MAG TPA: hypothetical protein VHZ07_10520 [Bryobacteraceae bacterium]|jgi:hypothetical protein|nr:hypothetical protein [Bryobacteraceae bacterium]